MGCCTSAGALYDDLAEVLQATAKQLRSIFRRLGTVVLPGSFTLGAPGSDAHYAGTFPMRAEPRPLETDRFGMLHGHPGLYIVDGSVLSALPTKSHTLTIMANAARIGAHIAELHAQSYLERRLRPA